ncbi:MAG: Hsp20/alpha crystallin family protein [Zetaproteobacteria bacterium]|nr:MAG: Hsp20/alpha crystallin family protein [Zetaproteobacteria bacterium]
MTVVRWSPWKELEDMQRSLTRLLDSDASANSERGTWLPAVDVRETTDALLIQAELPGIDKKDVRIELHEGRLTISGERKYEKEVNEENVYRIERAYGRFSRSFSLPRDIDTDAAEATMNNGVLEIRLPKKETAKPRSIEVR